MNRAAIIVVVAVEDHRLEQGSWIAAGGGIRLMISPSSSGTPTPVLPEQPRTSSGSMLRGLLHLLLDFVRPRVLEVDLVEHGTIVRLCSIAA